MTELRTAIPEEVDAYLDALVRKGVFSNKAELVRAALVSYVNETGTIFRGFDAETIFAPDGRLYQVEYARESAARGGTAAGLVGDAALVVDELRAAGPKSTDEAVKTVRGTLHRFTLSRIQRPLGAAFLLASVLDRKPRMAYVDPSGAVVESFAMAMGRGAAGARAILESRYRKMSLADAERLIPEIFGRETSTELLRLSA